MIGTQVDHHRSAYIAHEIQKELKFAPVESPCLFPGEEVVDIDGEHKAQLNAFGWFAAVERRENALQHGCRCEPALPQHLDQLGIFVPTTNPHLFNPGCDQEGFWHECFIMATTPSYFSRWGTPIACHCPHALPLSWAEMIIFNSERPGGRVTFQAHQFLRRGVGESNARISPFDASTILISIPVLLGPVTTGITMDCWPRIVNGPK